MTSTAVLANRQAGSFGMHHAFYDAAATKGARLLELGDENDWSRAMAGLEREPPERVVLVGGDGSVSRLVAALAQRNLDCEIAVIPAGTGNDLARSLGLPVDDPAAAWRLAEHGSASRVDRVCLSGDLNDWFINCITAGFGGRQAADIPRDQKSNWGRIGYWLSALTQLGDMPEYALSFEADGRQEEIRCLGFWIANGRYVGGGFPVAPAAVLNDGFMDLVVIPALPMLELLAAGLDTLVVGPEQSDHILTFRTSHLRLLVEPEAPLSVDGELRKARELECRVLPRSVRMVTGSVDAALAQVTP
jgi:YegS/Rv2252/BmrU family lipid kinase